MIKKLFNSIKQFIIEEYKFLIIMLTTVILFLFPVNYYIIIGGDISNIGNRVTVSSGYKSSGSFNICFVSELKGRLGPYLLSYIIPSWERESANDYKYDDEESIADISFRSELDLVSSNGNAIKWAYEAASLVYELIDTKVYVISVIKGYNDFKVGDQILEIDGVSINSRDDISDCLKEYKENDKIKVKVLRNGRKRTVESIVYSEDDRLLLGIYVQQVNSYETDPSVEIKFKSMEQGPSAGLITALSIYDQLVEEDLTQGLKIAGTGTIEEDGSIGTIGGVKYKLQGAVKRKADVFLVPLGENYDEAIRYKEKNNYDIVVIGVSSLDDAISKLENLEV